MMGVEVPETCWATHKRQVINLWNCCIWLVNLFDSVEITNKIQPCNRIYYSTVHWQLNMFRAAYHSSSGAVTVFEVYVLHKHVVTVRSQVWVGTEFPLRLDYDRSPHAYANHRLQIQLQLLMMSGMPTETCWAVNERSMNINLFELYDDARTFQHQTLNNLGIRLYRLSLYRVPQHDNSYHIFPRKKFSSVIKPPCLETRGKGQSYI